MVYFAVVGHKACTDPGFSLNDLPGGAGRLDLLCRCVQASLFLSHGIRDDSRCYLILKGEPGPEKTVLFDGAAVRSLSPDERSAASLIKKALKIPCGGCFRESTPGVFIRLGGLEKLLNEFDFFVLDESGADIRDIKNSEVPKACLLSDHQNFSAEEKELIKHLPKISLGPCVLHADHAIVLVHNECDRKEAGWR